MAMVGTANLRMFVRVAGSLMQFYSARKFLLLLVIVTGMEYHNPYSYRTVKGVFEKCRRGKTKAVYHRPVCRSA